MPMKPEMQELIDRGGGEDVYVQLGGIPYPAKTMVVQPGEELAPLVEMAALLQDVGDPDEITSDEATTFFGAGSMFPCRWLGDRHPTDGRRVMRPASAETGDVSEG